MAKRQRQRSLFTPRFSIPSSLVITHEFDISEPAAGIVNIAPTGRASFGVAFPSQKSHTSPS